MDLQKKSLSGLEYFRNSVKESKKEKETVSI